MVLEKKRGGGEEEGEEEEAGSPSCRGWGLQAEGQPGAVGEPQGESVSPEPCVPGDRAGVPPRGSGGSQRGGCLWGSCFFFHRLRGLCKLPNEERREGACVGQTTAEDSAGGGRGGRTLMFSTRAGDGDNS